MENKGFSAVEIKDADKGEVQAIFSTFNVIDSDNDVTMPDAFTDGTPVRISAYGHTSWMGQLPVGKGVIRTTKTEAILDGQFFMDTGPGRDTFQIIKAMGDLQEWSYGFDLDKFSFGQQDEKDVRFLEAIKVYEVSPVLIGAGVGTRTLGAKSLGIGDELSRMRDEIAELRELLMGKQRDEEEKEASAFLQLVAAKLRGL